MKIRDILKAKSDEVLTIHQKRTVHDAIKVLFKNKIGALLVVDRAEKPVGIVLWECVDRDNLLRKTLVKQVMTKELILGLPDDDINHSMGIMTQNRIRHLPVVDNDKIVGIISIGDLVKAQLDEREFENRYLQQYMFGSSQ
ncbi:CBS domain-containing protein [candidate division KSB1 bacterium]|nr:CBS domain-containing protein [candidate division KSB1 bacterium]